MEHVLILVETIHALTFSPPSLSCHSLPSVVNTEDKFTSGKTEM